jgi:hypothetical protein
VLLIDEVLAVGDAAFQQKCFAEFQRLKEEGRTIIFVTHDMGAVERFCDRALLLEKGRMVDLGEPTAIARRYNELNFGRMVHHLGVGDEERFGDGSATIEAIWFENENGAPIVEIGHGHPCRVCIDVRFAEAVENPVFGFALRNETGTTVFAVRSDMTDGETGSFVAGEQVVVRLELLTWLVAGTYSVTPSVARSGLGADALDLRADFAQIVVHGWFETGGVTNLPHTFEVTRR